MEIRIGIPPGKLGEAARLAGEAWWGRPPRAGEVERAMVRRNKIAVIALDRGHVVGITTATVRGRAATADETAVAPAWRGRGLGGRLLDRLLEELAARGVRVVRGESSPSRPEALRFVEAHGFRVVSLVTEAIPGRPAPRRGAGSRSAPPSGATRGARRPRFPRPSRGGTSRGGWRGSSARPARGGRPAPGKRFRTFRTARPSAG